MMDSYSFGLVCAWLLFYDYRGGEKRVFYEDVDPGAQPPIPLDTFLSSSSGNVPQAQVNALRELFTMTTKSPSHHSPDSAMPTTTVPPSEFAN